MSENGNGARTVTGRRDRQRSSRQGLPPRRAPSSPSQPRTFSLLNDRRRKEARRPVVGGSFPCAATTRAIRTPARDLLHFRPDKGFVGRALRRRSRSRGLAMDYDSQSHHPWFWRRVLCPESLEKGLFRRAIHLDSPHTIFHLDARDNHPKIHSLRRHHVSPARPLRVRTDGRRDCILTWHNRGTSQTPLNPAFLCALCAFA